MKKRPKPHCLADHQRPRPGRPQARQRHDAIAPAFTGIESADPPIHGMDADGAKNAAYQAAYRSCMRRKGF
jgi:hypothetical protein